MKIVIHLLLLASLLFLGACTSTRTTTPTGDSGTAATESNGTGSGKGLLMDRYTSGEIPGFRD